MHCSTHQIIGCHRLGDNQYEAVASPSIELHHHISDVKIPPDKKNFIFGLHKFPWSSISLADKAIAPRGLGLNLCCWIESFFQGEVMKLRRCIRHDGLIGGVTTTGRSVTREISNVKPSISDVGKRGKNGGIQND